MNPSSRGSFFERLVRFPFRQKLEVFLVPLLCAERTDRVECWLVPRVPGRDLGDLGKVHSD
jgi:hypothetical protein